MTDSYDFNQYQSHDGSLERGFTYDRSITDNQSGGPYYEKADSIKTPEITNHNPNRLIAAMHREMELIETDDNMATLQAPNIRRSTLGSFQDPVDQRTKMLK